MTIESFVVERRASLIDRARNRFRSNRAAIFRASFKIDERTKILDLGGYNGAHIHAALSGTRASPSNVTVADIEAEKNALRSAEHDFGYQTVALRANDVILPFKNASFDIVFCSSVLEHVTIPVSEIWTEFDGARFRHRAIERQQQFAAEIARVGNGYFVQVPYRWFPVEMHTWLPFFSYLPRALQIAVMATTNRFWIKGSIPDFYLPSAREFSQMFPTAKLDRESIMGLTKSLIAIKTT